MKGKIGYLVAAIIIFLVGILVGQLAGGFGKKKDITLSSGQTLGAKLTEMDQKLNKILTAGSGGPSRDQEFKFGLSNTPVLGDPEAKVKMVIFSDFLCPFCKKMADALEEMVKAEPKKFALFSKEYVVHPGAILEHQAALAAHAQGKYWEMHDLLFQNQPELGQLSRGEGDKEAFKNKLTELAKSIGLDTDKFKADLDNESYLPQIQADMEEGKNAEVPATPTVFINGYFYGYNPDELKAKARELAGEKPGIEATLTSIDQKIEQMAAYVKSVKAARERPKGLEQGKKYEFDLSNAPVIGNRGAKTQVVVFSDFQCPFCEQMAGLLEQVQAEHPNNVAVFFKNFVVHAPAGIEHEAAMSANAQGKFKQMHDILFKNRAELTKLSGEGEEKLTARILELAAQAGVNVNKLKADLDSNKYQEMIAKDMNEGREAEIGSTPTVLVNGYFYGFQRDAIKAKIYESMGLKPPAEPPSKPAGPRFQVK